MTKNEMNTLAASAANDWCRCFKCDRIVNETGDQCLKPCGTCTKWFDAYKGAMIALEKLEKQKERKPTNSEEPDKSQNEAAESHIREVVDAAGHPGWDWTTQDVSDAFIAGAKWQKEQMMEGKR